MIPLFHDFEDETVLVFGGGPVGARKARRFSRDARVIVLSPVFDAKDYGDATLVRAAPGPDAIPDWFDRTAPALVVAATDDGSLNGSIESTARTRGILVNRADRSGDRDVGSVVVPATVRDGDVTVAVSTGGRSPALAKELRRRIADEIDGAETLADLTAEIRESLKTSGVDPESRRQAVRDVVQADTVWDDITTEGVDPRRTINDVIDDAIEDVVEDAVDDALDR